MAAGTVLEPFRYSEVASGGGDTAVTTAPATLRAVRVTVATATDIITIRNGSGGDIVLTIPAGKVLNDTFEMYDVGLSKGIYVDFTGTGTLLLIWQGA